MEPNDELDHLNDLNAQLIKLMREIKHALDIDETATHYSMWYILRKLYDRMTELGG